QSKDVFAHLSHSIDELKEGVNRLENGKINKRQQEAFGQWDGALDKVYAMHRRVEAGYLVDVVEMRACYAILQAIPQPLRGNDFPPNLDNVILEAQWVAEQLYSQAAQQMQHALQGQMARNEQSLNA